MTIQSLPLPVDWEANKTEQSIAFVRNAVNFLERSEDTPANCRLWAYAMKVLSGKAILHLDLTPEQFLRK
jgi:hypothetical protein